MKKIYVFIALLCAMLSGIAVFSQQKSAVIKGVVTDETNSPLAGVSVSVKGTTRGVATNEDGVFAIEVGGPDDVLVFSLTGAQTKEVKAGSRKSLNVTLTTSA